MKEFFRKVVFSARRRASAGAKFLDGVNPEWFKNISLERLYMWDGEKCIFGQLYGHYLDGRDKLGLSPEQCVEYGVAIPCDSYYIDTIVLSSYSRLKRAWVREICRRRANQAVA